MIELMNFKKTCILVGCARDVREKIEAAGDPEQIKTTVSREEMEQWAADYRFAGAIECSSKTDMEGL